MSVISGTRHPETLFASDEVMARVESVQFTLGEGPCFEAFTTRRPVLVPDLRRALAERWPTFASEIADQPIGAIFAFPIQSGSITIGAMDMYRRDAGLLTTAELATALAGGGRGRDGPGRRVLRRAGHRHRPRQARTGTPGRAEVHQATGMLISRLGVSAEQVLARLRGYAFAAGRPIEDVSSDIVTHRLPLDAMSDM